MNLTQPAQSRYPVQLDFTISNSSRFNYCFQDVAANAVTVVSVVSAIEAQDKINDFNLIE